MPPPAWQILARSVKRRGLAILDGPPRSIGQRPLQTSRSVSPFPTSSGPISVSGTSRVQLRGLGWCPACLSCRAFSSSNAAAEGASRELPTHWPDRHRRSAYARENTPLGQDSQHPGVRWHCVGRESQPGRPSPHRRVAGSYKSQVPASHGRSLVFSR